MKARWFSSSPRLSPETPDLLPIVTLFPCRGLAKGSPTTSIWFGLFVPTPTPPEARIRNWFSPVEAKSPLAASAQTNAPLWLAAAWCPAARLWSPAAVLLRPPGTAEKLPLATLFSPPPTAEPKPSTVRLRMPPAMVETGPLARLSEPRQQWNWRPERGCQNLRLRWTHHCWKCSQCLRQRWRHGRWPG